MNGEHLTSAALTQSQRHVNGAGRGREGSVLVGMQFGNKTFTGSGRHRLVRPPRPCTVYTVPRVHRDRPETKSLCFHLSMHPSLQSVACIQVTLTPTLPFHFLQPHKTTYPILRMIYVHWLRAVQVLLLNHIKQKSQYLFYINTKNQSGKIADDIFWSLFLRWWMHVSLHTFLYRLPQ